MDKLSDILGLLSQPSANGLSINRGSGMNQYGARHADSPLEALQMKSRGYFGEIPNKGGGSSTELSSSFDVGGNILAHPLLVPTLTADEIRHLVSGGKPTDEIYGKAQSWALQRMKDGQSPFATNMDLRFPVQGR